MTRLQCTVASRLASLVMMDLMTVTAAASIKAEVDAKAKASVFRNAVNRAVAVNMAAPNMLQFSRCVICNAVDRCSCKTTATYERERSRLPHWECSIHKPDVAQCKTCNASLAFVVFTRNVNVSREYEKGQS